MTHVTLQKIVAHDFRYDPRIFDLRRTERSIIRNVHRSSLYNTRYSSQILMKLGFSRQISEKQ